MPVIVMVKLKLVTVFVDEAAVSVNIAAVDAPAAKGAPALSQLKVKTPLAPALQVEFVMLNVNCWFPVFFM